MPKRKSRRDPAVACRWVVEADYSTGVNLGTRRGWQRIYCARSKKKAQGDARKWHGDTKMVTRVSRNPEGR